MNTEVQQAMQDYLRITSKKNLQQKTQALASELLSYKEEELLELFKPYFRVKIEVLETLVLNLTEDCPHIMLPYFWKNEGDLELEQVIFNKVSGTFQKAILTCIVCLKELAKAPNKNKLSKYNWFFDIITAMEVRSVYKFTPYK